MREQRHAAVVIESDDERPQIGHVTRHLPCPIGMTIRPCLARRRILDPVRMRRQRRADRTDVEDVRLRPAIEDLRGERMGDGDDGDVRLLAKASRSPNVRCAVRSRIRMSDNGLSVFASSSAASTGTSPSPVLG